MRFQFLIRWIVDAFRQSRPISKSIFIFLVLLYPLAGVGPRIRNLRRDGRESANQTKAALG